MFRRRLSPSPTGSTQIEDRATEWDMLFNIQKIKVNFYESPIRPILNIFCIPYTMQTYVT